MSLKKTIQPRMLLLQIPDPVRTALVTLRMSRCVFNRAALPLACSLANFIIFPCLLCQISLRPWGAR